MVLAIEQWQFLSTKGNAQQTFWEGTFVPCVHRTVHGRIYSPRTLQLNRHLALPCQQRNQLLLLRWGKKSKLCWRKGSNSSHSKDPQLLFHYFWKSPLSHEITMLNKYFQFRMLTTCQGVGVTVHKELVRFERTSFSLQVLISSKQSFCVLDNGIQILCSLIRSLACGSRHRRHPSWQRASGPWTTSELLIWENWLIQRVLTQSCW